ncbi:hypothetical protein C8A05DRAFT_13697, partial [Staphylotrichum tortipilum]
LEGTNVGRRRRVVPDPNQRFVNIEQIHRAQVAAGRIEDPVAEESRPSQFIVLLIKHLFQLPKQQPSGRGMWGLGSCDDGVNST